MSFFLLTVSATSETYTLSLHDALPISDVHEDTPLDEVASVVDVLQTPAFLCRQTNFIQNVARCGKPMNIKKGQFLRSEEHTSELQSRGHLVCRLLLEKKKLERMRHYRL